MGVVVGGCGNKGVVTKVEVDKKKRGGKIKFGESAGVPVEEEGVENRRGNGSQVVQAKQIYVRKYRTKVTDTQWV